jgi:hypothetical protein
MFEKHLFKSDFIQRTFKTGLFFLFSVFCCSVAISQVKILFDATKAETAGSADWVIDADTYNLGYGTGPAILGTGNESNPQRIPSPAQSTISAATAETYWQGGLSFWGIDCVNRGYTVETLPYNGRISFGDATNPQDLSNYNAYIVCEPNILFTAAEKTAILSFVANGGGLFIVSDHTVSDRNNDGFDSPEIWNDLFQNNGTGNTNPFGILYDLQNFSQTSANIAALPVNDSILHGPMGDVSKVLWANGTSMTINPSANPAVKAVVYETSVAGATGNNKVMVAYSRFGFGKVVAIGDSSPCDDGSGDPNDSLFPGYNGDVTPNHRHLLMNGTIWLVARDPRNYVFTGNGNWNVATNWLYSVMPPATLGSGDTITISNTAGGQCVLNVTQYLSAGAKLNVLTGKKLVIPGSLSIQ